MVSTGALRGIRVAEFGTGSAAAYCGKLFADFGASVVKVEPPGGDPGRGMVPLVDRGDGVQESGVFAWLNTNKQSVIGEDGDDARLLEIAGASDVLIDQRPGAGADEGPTGHAALRATFPKLTIVALSWFGESGPYQHYKATDGVVRALASLVKATGSVEQPGLQSEHQAYVPAALNAFTAAMASMLGGGERGRRFEVSIHDANVALADFQLAVAVQLDLDETRTGVNRWYPTFPVGVYECKEGWIGITATTPDQWQGFCTLFDMHEQAADPRFTLPQERLALADELEAVFVPKLLAKTAHEWFEEAMRLRLPFTVTPAPTRRPGVRPNRCWPSGATATPCRWPACASSTWPWVGPAHCRRGSWPTSAPRSSRSRAGPIPTGGGAATTPSSPSPSTRTRWRSTTMC
jgi:crotonobetainyl-CoA:carnitine CoA-transferase CaiB-like acyl-CoA transferase